MNPSTKPTTRRVPRRRPSLRSTIATVTAIAFSGFLLLLAGLAIQMMAGADPALGPKAHLAQAKRPVVTRRIVRRTVTVHKIRPTGPTAVDSTPAAGSSSPEAGSTASSPAPVAPAPAPVVTRVS